VNATVDNYPINHTDPLLRQTTEVIDEPIVEFSPTGEVIEMWSMVDLLDTTRTNYAGISEDGPPHDWIHTNAVIEDPSDDSIIISMRHQDAVVKFDRATGSLVWILGPHENWSPAFQPFLLDPVDPNLQWQFHQHAPMITAEGTLMIFDNGNEKASPYDGRPQVADEDNDTRAVEYSIDEANMTVSEVWEFGSQAVPRLFAPFIGDADTLPGTGNVLITFGGTRFIDGVASTDLGYGGVVARITEVTRETPAEKVFDVMLTHDTGWVAVYRSDRIPTLYAEDVTVTTTN
jgi:hypothetical protein